MIENPRELLHSYHLAENQRLEATKKCQYDWGLLNSDLLSISRDFQGTLPDSSVSYNTPPDKLMEKYLKKTFSHKKGGIVFVEMGGEGQKLAIDIGKFLRVKQSIGVTLPDGLTRSINTGSIRLKENPKTHSIIQGDMFLPKTRYELQKELNGNKVDILIERMVAGLNLLPHESTIWKFRNLNRWYQLLNDGGIMFIQMPWTNGNNAIISERERWIDKVNEINNIEIQTNNIREIRIRKLSEAPNNLPY